MRITTEVETEDGIAPAWQFTPDNGVDVKGSVLFLMDAIGPRPSLDAMAQRLADNGYRVVLPDLFYRFGSYGPFRGSAFQEESSRRQILKMIHETSQEMTSRDAAKFLELLRSGARERVGIVGYCMGGGRALTIAANYADQIAAVASFHGGNLASDAADSPHLLASKIQARIYVGAAGEDSSFPPEQSTRLTDTFRKSDLDFVFENYVGCEHGWTVPDRDGCYNQAGSERHWRRLLTLFAETISVAPAA